MLTNKAQFTSYELASLFGENNLYNISEIFAARGVLIDTRLLDENNIFVALKGANIDGHSLVENAFSNGASACIIERQYAPELLKKYPNKSFIITDNNLDALSKLANFHRLRFDYPVIAVGGANGKTTTKEMIAEVLSQKFKVLKTYGNYNNHIGVPLMLLQMSDEYNMTVLEIGTNSPGEIYDLSRIAKPTHALVTNIGKEHLEFLIDLDGVELEETSLFAEVRTDGFAFVNYDDERLKNYGHILGKFTTYGTHEHAQFRCEYTLTNNLNPVIKVLNNEETFIINMKTIGYTSALNAIAALTIGAHFDIEPVNLISALENFKPLVGDSGYGRMALNITNGITIINDTYNANPDSMLAALKNLEMIELDGKKIAILGDMRELGESAFEEHQEIISFACSVADRVLLTGDEMLKAYKNISSDKILFFDNKNEIINFVADEIKAGDCILVKGSRGVRMEEVVSALTKLIGVK